MSEHMQIDTNASDVAVKVSERGVAIGDEQMPSFKRRIDCEDSRERLPEPMREQRNGRGGRRRTDKPAV